MAGASNPVIRELVFSDVNVTFTPHPVTGKLPVLKNMDAIKRAVRNLILTNYFERPYEPTFGGNIRALLFENANDPLLDDIIVKQIEQAIFNYEPRAKLIDTKVTVDNDSNSVFIKITFIGINDRFPVELDVQVERVR